MDKSTAAKCLASHPLTRGVVSTPTTISVSQLDERSLSSPDPAVRQQILLHDHQTHHAGD